MGTFIITEFFRESNPTSSAKFIHLITICSVVKDNFVLFFQ